MTIGYTGHSNTDIPLAAITSGTACCQICDLQPSASSEQHSRRTHHQSSQYTVATYCSNILVASIKCHQ